MAENGKNYLPITELKETFVTQKQHFDSMAKIDVRFDIIDKKLDNHLAHVGKDISSIRKDLDSIHTRKDNIVISKRSIKRELGIIIIAILGSSALWEGIKYLFHI